MNRTTVLWLQVFREEKQPKLPIWFLTRMALPEVIYWAARSGSIDTSEKF